MREIRFRAWDGERMVNPQYNGERFSVCTNWKYTKDGAPPYWDYTDDVMQYTGLKDKNGVEIYEGDIIKDGLSPRVFGFEEKRKTSYGHGDSGTTLYVGYIFYFWGSGVGEIEVMGNIYENPSLL